jgi:serine/threonine protein phosphatase PrpC
MSSDSSVRIGHVRQGVPTVETADTLLRRESLSCLLALDEFRSVSAQVRVELLDGDTLLLCTNGLTDVVSDERIAEVLAYPSGGQRAVRPAGRSCRS